MIHVVTIANQHLYAKQLDEMFRMRHEFYIKQRGWTNLTGSEGRETDEFDNDHAVYLMNLDRYGAILSTFRINPTTTPYLLGDKLTEYLDGAPPRDESIWDLTRWMITPDARRKSSGEIASAQKELICGVMEFAVDRGITSYTCLTDTVFVERLERVWPVHTLGQPRHFEDGNGEAVAVMIEAGPHILATSRDKTGIYGSVLFELKPSPPQDEKDKSMRENAITSEKPLTPANVRRVREAADHLVSQLEGLNGKDVESTIQMVNDFTRFVADSTGGRELEDA